MLSAATHFLQFIFLRCDKLCQRVQSFIRVYEYREVMQGPVSLDETNNIWAFKKQTCLNVAA